MNKGDGVNLRYCGNCGAALDAAAISSGICPTCGIALDPSTVSASPQVGPAAADDLQQTVLDTGGVAADEDPWGPTVPLELRLMTNEPMALASARPNTARLARVPANQPVSPLNIIGLGVGLGVALLLVLACTLSLLTLGSHPSSGNQAVQPFNTATIGPTATDAGLGFATQPDPTPLPYTAPSPLPTMTPFGGIPTATTSTDPTATPTPDNGQATLVVGASVCVSKTHAEFPVSATGNGNLQWQASASQPVILQIQPNSGTLSGGQSQNVSVKGVDLSNPITITVTASPGNQSGSVTVQC
jgi:hypothetical protein